MEQATGIEPASQAWEARVLPLNYACAMCWKLIYKVPLNLQVNFYSGKDNYGLTKIEMIFYQLMLIFQMLHLRR